MKGDTNSVFGSAGNQEKAEILGCMLKQLEGSYGKIFDQYPADKKCKLGYGTICGECGLTADGISAHALGNKSIEDARGMIEDMKKYVETTEEDLTGKTILDVILASR